MFMAKVSLLIMYKKILIMSNKLFYIYYNRIHIDRFDDDLFLLPAPRYTLTRLRKINVYLSFF